LEGVRPTRARTNAVDTNTFFELLIRQGSCECHDGSLGRRIVEQIATTDVWVDRCTVDDGGSSFHMRQSILREVEEWMDVRVEGSLPLVPAARSA
jgi:hypothetical protein